MPFKFDATYNFKRPPLPTVGAFDPKQYMDRLQTIRDKSNQSKDAAVQSAALKRMTAQQDAATAQQDALAKANEAIQARALASRTKVSQLEKSTAGQTARNNQNALLRQQRVAQSRMAQPIGTSATSNKGGFTSPGQVVLPTGKGAASKRAAGIINEALKYRGTMYHWGGSSPKTGFDCSGLVQWAFRSVGVSIPRVSRDQANTGRKVALSALRPGDLVAWDNSSRNAGADHIAIYIGNGQTIQAPRPGQPVTVEPINDASHAWGVQIL